MANETKKTGGAAPAGTPRAAGGPHVRPPRAERRPEMIRQRREERRQVYERRQRQWMFVRIGIIALVVLIIAGIGYGIFTVVRDRQLNVVPEGTLTDFAYAGNDHTADLSEVVVYAETPPVGGRHARCPTGRTAATTTSRSAARTPSTRWSTAPSGSPTGPTCRRIRSTSSRGWRRTRRYVLVSPYDGLPAPIVASAWNRQLYLDSADDIAADPVHPQLPSGAERARTRRRLQRRRRRADRVISRPPRRSVAAEEAGSPRSDRGASFGPRSSAGRTDARRAVEGVRKHLEAGWLPG